MTFGAVEDVLLVHHRLSMAVGIISLGRRAVDDSTLAGRLTLGEETRSSLPPPARPDGSLRRMLVAVEGRAPFRANAS